MRLIYFIHVKSGQKQNYASKWFKNFAALCSSDLSSSFILAKNPTITVSIFCCGIKQDIPNPTV